MTEPIHYVHPSSTGNYPLEISSVTITTAGLRELRVKEDYYARTKIDLRIKDPIRQALFEVAADIYKNGQFTSESDSPLRFLTESSTSFDVAIEVRRTASFKEPVEKHCSGLTTQGLK